MEVSKRAAVWLRRRLPQGFEPIDVIPRAYCAAKPAPLCAVFVTPPDNADEARLALLDEATAARLRRKYAKAMRMLAPAAQDRGRPG